METQDLHTVTCGWSRPVGPPHTESTQHQETVKHQHHDDQRYHHQPPLRSDAKPHCQSLRGSKHVDNIFQSDGRFYQTPKKHCNDKNQIWQRTRRKPLISYWMSGLLHWPFVWFHYYPWLYWPSWWWPCKLIYRLTLWGTNHVSYLTRRSECFGVMIKMCLMRQCIHHSHRCLCVVCCVLCVVVVVTCFLRTDSQN